MRERLAKFGRRATAADRRHSSPPRNSRRLLDPRVHLRRLGLPQGLQLHVAAPAGAPSGGGSNSAPPKETRFTEIRSDADRASDPVLDLGVTVRWQGRPSGRTCPALLRHCGFSSAVGLPSERPGYPWAVRDGPESGRPRIACGPRWRLGSSWRWGSAARPRSARAGCTGGGPPRTALRSQSNLTSLIRRRWLRGSVRT